MNLHYSDSPLILLVEENNPHCDLLQSKLIEQNFLTIRAHDACDALKLNGDCPLSFHLLLTRIRLSGMSGPELTRHLRIRSPGMAILYLAESLSEMMEVTEVQDFLSSLVPSPFSPELLVRRITSLIAAKPIAQFLPDDSTADVRHK